MRISIIGCGWLGLPLARRLVAKGYVVKGSTTNPAKVPEMQTMEIEPFLLDVGLQGLQDLLPSPFFECDILVITLPPSVGDNYGAVISTLAEVAIARGIDRILYTSSTSVYGEPNCIVDELSPARPSTRSGRLVLEAEYILREAKGIVPICVRFGGLIGPGRSPAGFFKGKDKIPNGLAPINLIHLEDCLGILVALIERVRDPLTINAVSPHHPTRMTFYITAALAVDTDSPSFIVEKTSWKIVTSVYLKSVLRYQFKIYNWHRWIKSAEFE